MSITIRTEKESDKQTVWIINQAAFGGDDEANLVDALRDTDHATITLTRRTSQELSGMLRSGIEAQLCQSKTVHRTAIV